MASLAVVVPAGGRGRRLAGGKLAVDVTGRTLLDRTLDGLPPQALVVCVGPELSTDRAVTWEREIPEYAGPLAAVQTGVAALPAEVLTVVLVGGDMPAAGRAIPALLAELAAGRADHNDASRTTADCAVVTDPTGRMQPLLSAWHRTALVTRVKALAPTAGRPLAALLDGVTLALVEDRWGATDDVDTPSDLAAARERFRQPHP